VETALVVYFCVLALQVPRPFTGSFMPVGATSCQLQAWQAWHRSKNHNKQQAKLSRQSATGHGWDKTAGGKKTTLGQREEIKVKEFADRRLVYPA
jgi:hypothetical protein